MTQDHYKEVNDSLKLVFDLTSRIDERMKILVSNYEEAKVKIDKLADQQNAFLHKIVILETSKEAVLDLKKELVVIENKVEDFSERLMYVEKEIQSHASKWATFFDFIFKIAIIVVGALILWKLGLKP